MTLSLKSLFSGLLFRGLIRRWGRKAYGMRGFVKAGAVAAVWLGLVASAMAAGDEHSYFLVNAGQGRVDFADQNARHQRDGSVSLSLLSVFPSGRQAYAISQVSLNCAQQTLA